VHTQDVEPQDEKKNSVVVNSENGEHGVDEENQFMGSLKVKIDSDDNIVVETDNEEAED